MPDWKPKDPHAPDGLAMLVGRISQPSFGEQLAGVVLGVGIGAYTDLDKTDEYILGRCRELLEKIRAAKASPEAVAMMSELQDKVR